MSALVPFVVLGLDYEQLGVESFCRVEFRRTTVQELLLMLILFAPQL